jgi:acyl dehydratase
MRALVGLESNRAALEVERGAIRTFARSTGETNPIYYDVEAARAAGHPDLPAPPAFLGRFVYTPGVSDPTFSGPVEEHRIAPADFPKELHGSTRLRMHRRVYAGERLFVTNRVAGLSERDGRLGRMLIVDTVATYRDEAGDLVAERFDTELYYR